MTADLPNPGSPEAVERGCTCPVIDNTTGKACRIALGLCFWIDGDCPLHAAPATADPETGR